MQCIAHFICGKYTVLKNSVDYAYLLFQDYDDGWFWCEKCGRCWVSDVVCRLLGVGLIFSRSNGSEFAKVFITTNKFNFFVGWAEVRS